MDAATNTHPTLTVIIPAYNEADAIGVVVEDVHGCGYLFLHEVIVVDDGSHDATTSVAAAHGARVLRHPRNRGYGAALKTGIRAATTPYVLTMDADGQHRASDIGAAWQAARANDLDMVVGQRIARLHSPLWRMPGKWLLGALANFLAGEHIPDLNSGFRLMRADLVTRYMHLCPSGFSFSTTITLALYNRGAAVGYTPIEVRRRTGGPSTVSVRTGLDTLVLILRLAALFEPLRVFLPICIMLVLAGIVWGVPYLLLGNGVSVGAMLAIFTGVQLFAVGLVCDQIARLRLERYE